MDVNKNIGLHVAKYRLAEYVGSGKIGSVYRAVSLNVTNAEVACKLIPAGKLKDGWERELEKLALLDSVPCVARYRDSGACIGSDNRPYVYILYDFINGVNLRVFLSDAEATGGLSISTIEWLLESLLTVLFACEKAGIVHGDIHAGNILVARPNPLLPTDNLKVFVADFGYGGSHNGLAPKDDRRQIFSITKDLLRKVRNSTLTPRDRLVRKGLLELCDTLLETDATQVVVRLAGVNSLYERFKHVVKDAEIQANAGEEEDDIGRVDDYLAAEAMGTRTAPWRSLFVPDYVTTHSLLGKHNAVLTGARGCGKTMAFRRLTVLMDSTLGKEPSWKDNRDFAGFYVSSRNFVEAFPWTPKSLNRVARAQVIHYFNLCWLIEFVRGFDAVYKNGLQIASAPARDLGWLIQFVKSLFPSFEISMVEYSSLVDQTWNFLEQEKHRVKHAPLGKDTDESRWTLRDFDFLDRAHGAFSRHVHEWSGQPYYLFLDDYTIPTIPRQLQETLNPIIFKRRENVFFKVSSEASNSFLWTELNGKPLELPHDFQLIDLASETFTWSDEKRIDILNKIFSKRIERDIQLKGKAKDLWSLLGSHVFSNNTEAAKLRKKQRVHYSGVQVYVDMWSSDVRTMIKVLTDLISSGRADQQKESYPIAKFLQDKVYRRNGGEFLAGMRLNKNPIFWSAEQERATSPGTNFGEHMAKIIEAFVSVARWELREGDLVKNESSEHPKQAFRIEIIDELSLAGNARDYYEGLIRWHAFLQDWRGKSVRGFMTPRLYLNRLLIPYSSLTFSRHDSIGLQNVEFVKLLESPTKFLAYWKKKKRPPTQQQPLI